MTYERSLIPRSRWPLRPLWSLVRSRDEFGGALPLLSLSAQSGVRERPIGEGRAASEDTSRYRVVRPDDLVVNRLSARDGAYGVSRLTGLVSPVYWVLFPSTDELESAWLGYVLRSDRYLAEIGRLSKYMPPAQFDLSWDAFRSMRIPVPPLESQRAIVGHLDEETGRLAALVAAKRRLAAVVRERTRARVTALFDALVADEAPLGRFVVGLTQGESPQAGGRPAEVGERGLLKLSAVKDGQFRPEENKVLPEGEVLGAISPTKGDLLVTRSNTPNYVGDACAVADDHPDLVICDLIYRLRLAPALDPQYAALCLRQPRQRALLSAIARGTSQSMVKLRGEDIRSIPICTPDVDEQRELVSRARAVRGHGDRIIHDLERQVDLLTEHRHALITEAVTGALEIPGVA